MTPKTAHYHHHQQEHQESSSGEGKKLLLDQPVLTLAIDNLSKLNQIDEKQLSAIWNLFTKCKDNLENGRRLENISWRLWYRSCHPPSGSLDDEEDGEHDLAAMLDEEQVPELISPASSSKRKISQGPSASSSSQPGATFGVPLPATTATTEPALATETAAKSPSAKRVSALKKLHKKQTTVTPASFTRVLDMDYRRPFDSSLVVSQQQKMAAPEKDQSHSLKLSFSDSLEKNRYPSSSMEPPSCNPVDSNKIAPSTSPPVTLARQRTTSFSAPDPYRPPLVSNMETDEPDFGDPQGQEPLRPSPALEHQQPLVPAGPRTSPERPRFFISSSQVSEESLVTGGLTQSTPSSSMGGVSMARLHGVVPPTLPPIESSNSPQSETHEPSRLLAQLPDSLEMRRGGGDRDLLTHSRRGRTTPAVVDSDATFDDDNDSYISDGSSDFYSDEEGQELDSGDETELSCYGESWSYTPSPLFQKVALTHPSSNLPTAIVATNTSMTPMVAAAAAAASFWPPSRYPQSSKGRSLLSAALDGKRKGFSGGNTGSGLSRTGSQQRLPFSNANLDESSQGLSHSVRQTLLWDRCMPFNTRMDPTKQPLVTKTILRGPETNREASSRVVPSSPNAERPSLLMSQSVPNNDDPMGDSPLLSWNQELGAYW